MKFNFSYKKYENLSFRFAVPKNLLLMV